MYSFLFMLDLNAAAAKPDDDNTIDEFDMLAQSRTLERQPSK